MTSFRLKNACVILLVLILCQEILVYSVEARHLRGEASKNHRSRRQRDQNSFKMPKINGNVHSSGSGQEQSSKVEYVDDFRPTAPGHSPGAALNNAQQWLSLCMWDDSVMSMWLN
ncbi:hypothetical protein GOBAR_AA07495 [Gossypium barbadense]|uniref:Uncharacterized protein n=1 Tax=Gossypium barbadense TaxID=3634 RepID=A0A2P5YC56_GOSBA|nr:hypothetical protein GOBAR_AA07495 [Gossypium barbadense]